jgi:hypothetical protein
MSGGIIMENIVTMSLEDYDKLKETINNQKKYIEQLTRDRVEELKGIFKLDPSYRSVGIFIDATKVIKEIYGEEIIIKNSKYELDKEKITLDIYGLYKEVKEETEEGE